MIPVQESSGEPLDLGQLFRQYLSRQVDAEAAGLGLADTHEEVVPHEAVPMQPVDPRQAWHDALAVAAFLGAEKTSGSWSVPPQWPFLVTAQEPAVALAFCLGCFPQMVRHLQPLLSSQAPSALCPGPSRPLSVPGLMEWAVRQRSYPAILLAGGLLRLACHFDRAAELLQAANPVPAAWQALHANELAALAWHRGDADDALALWQLQPDSVPVLFNRGMALLFLGRPASARPPLTAAVEQLPETSAWHHLGQLYLALAQR